METVINLKTSELSENFFKGLLLVFGKDKNDEITISYKSFKPRVLQKESREEYIATLNKAIGNIEEKKNVIHFSGKEFKALTKKLLKK